MDLTAIRSNFSHLDRWIFLNHAAQSPLPRPVVTAMKDYLDDAAHNGPANETSWFKRVDEHRAGLALMLGCDASEIAFVKNTSEGLSIVSNGINWVPGDNVIISNVEFPANVYPWLSLKLKGIDVRFVQERDGRIHADDVFALADERTKAISLSLVQFASGFRIPAEEIGEFCQERGILFVLDAYQAAGVMRVDVQALRADAVVSAFHKWLMGPDAVGFLYVRKESMDRIAVTEWGWKSVTVPYTTFDYALDLVPDASRYECGSLNIAGMMGSAAAVEMYLAAGIDAVQSRVLGLTDRLCDELTSRGYRIFSPRGDAEKSGILCFDHPEHPTSLLLEKLTERRVVVIERGGRVRVSPHYYNSDEEINAFLNALP